MEKSNCEDEEKGRGVAGEEAVVVEPSKKEV